MSIYAQTPTQLIIELNINPMSTSSLGPRWGKKLETNISSIKTHMGTPMSY